MADRFAVELGHADAETEEHPFDLVVQTFVYREAAGGFGGEFDLCGSGAGVFFFKRHPIAKLLEDVFRDGLVGLDEVGFRDVIFWGGEGCGKTGIVSEDHESGGSAVESAREVKFGCPGFVDQIDDRAMSFIGGR